MARDVDSISLEKLRQRCRTLEELLRSARGADPGFLRQILDIIPHFVFAKDRAGRFTLVNQAIAEAYGTTVEDLIGRTDADFNSNADEVAHFRCDDLEVMDSLREKLIAEEVITDAAGRVRWLQTIKRPIVGPDGTADQILGVATDITRHKELTEQLGHAALHDSLTGLPNRALFVDRLAVAFERAQRVSDDLFAVLFLDLDRFKLVNDGLGHALGDQLLVAVAERLVRCVRPGDTVARLGGDEFVVLATIATGSPEAVRIAERIHAALHAPVALDGREVYVSASIGIALRAPSYSRPDELLRDADTAMYRAKTGARGCHVVFDPAMHTMAVAQLDLETDLRRAIDRRELYLVYQPIVRVDDGTIVGFEALLRWRHPERGMLDPDSFLPIASETGLLLQIEHWALAEACRQAAEWRALPGCAAWSVSLNLSGPQFSMGDPVARVTDALETAQLAPSSLRIEITETTVLDRFEPVIRVLHGLREIGVLVDVDDFGTGYSSLSYLHRLPVDRLKIDRSFVQRLDDDGDAFAIAHTIVTLADALGLGTSAEGVETSSQLERLRTLGCDHAQGFLFSPALNASQLAQLPATLPLPGP